MLLTMRLASRVQDPAQLSYFALRKAVGGIALGLPFAVAIPWLWCSHTLESSISSYYYTGMRNLFEGSLCAIALFQLFCRGYDVWDEAAGVLSGIFALGVAFCPTTPDQGATAFQERVGLAHYIFAGLLFTTLAVFCLVLFRMSAHGHVVTPMKVWRNRVYTACGIVILGSLAAILILVRGFKVMYLPGGIGTVFFFETTSLWAFGAAWLIKGQTLLKD
jgi:hypothetical protein